MALMTQEQEKAVLIVADRYGWAEMSTHQVGLLLWALFRYYAMRLR